MRLLEGMADLPPMLSVEDTCKLLGLSRSVGYRAIAAGQLPTLRIGRRIFVPTGRLLGLLGLNGQEAESERRWAGAGTARG